MTAARLESSTEDRFSATLRAATADLHRSTESAGYLANLTGGKLSLPGYTALVAQHHHIYAALESATDAMRADPVAGVFVHDALLRLPALEADLLHLHGPGWAEAVPITPATQEYAERLRAVCATWPAGFVAHHYTRYLGDLSGGLFIAQAIRRVYGLTHDGVRFYEFDQIPDAREFKRAYRAALDSATWPAGERVRLIDEVRLAYDLNARVFTELERATRGFLVADPD